MKIRIYIIALLLLITQSVFAMEQHESFLDHAIDTFYQDGIIKSKEINPNERITKVDFLKMLLENMGYEAKKRLIFTPTIYKDVEPKSWYAPYVQEAYRLSLIERKDYFKPSAPIQIGDAIKIALKAEGYTLPRVIKNKYQYSDVVEREEKIVLEKVMDLQVFNPHSRSIFGWHSFLKKGEALEFLYRLRLIAESDKVIYIEKNVPELQLILEDNLSSEYRQLQDVRDQVFTRYYDKEHLDENKLIQGAIKGFVKEIGDKYSVYFPAPDADSFNDSLEGSFEGIGAYLEDTDDGVIVKTPIKDSPAEKAGVKAGDIIRKVNKKDVEGISINELVKLIKGKKGTEVLIEFERNGERVEISIIRDTINLHSVQAEVRDNVLVITLSQFAATTSIDFADIVNEMWSPTYSGIVLDLRSNPGGFLNTAEDILAYWIDKDQATLQLKFKNHTQVKLANTNQSLSEVKTAVIQNSASASASEILAGSLQDYQKAKIFGEKSFGKGTVQEIIPYRDGASLKLTVAEWLTAKGNSINESGVMPDTEISDDPDTLNDEPLDAAIKWLKN